MKRLMILSIIFFSTVILMSCERSVSGPGVTPKAWGTAELLEENDVGGASGPQIAVDGAGNAIAVWHQDDGTRNNLWANTYAAGTGWGTAELLEENDAGWAYGPQIAVDSAGNAIVVWLQYDNLWANTYAAGTGWGTAELIEENDAGRATGPQIAVDGAGNAIVVWQQSDGTGARSIWANTYTAGTGWGAAELFVEGVSGLEVNRTTTPT